jgi:hypothetical protein
MKNLFKLLALLTVLTFSFTAAVRAQDAPPPPPDDQGDDQGASFQTFYDQLSDQGNWVQTDNYGYVFQPNVQDPNWAPYTDGHWVYTDEGWTWVSDEPWGWATYHYGRWCNIDGTGWCWVPGYRWAPAWVSWRYGGGYAGWAPLPPDTFIGAEYGGGVGIGFHFGGDVDVNFNIGPGCYNFVNVGDMGEPNYRGHYIDRSRNFTVINNTTNITNIKVVNNYGGRAGGFGGVTAGGPSLNEVNAQSHTHIATVQLAQAGRPGRSTLQGNSLAVYAPRVNPATAHSAKPARVAQTIAHPTFNRGDSITKPLQVSPSIRPAAPTAEAIQAAKTAQAHAPATARIATSKTRVKTPITKPLTSMTPVTQAHHATTSAATSGTNERTAAPSEEHAAASPYTGEAKPEAKPETETEKPASHPETEAKPETAYHPETEAKPAATHTESEEKPEAEHHTESAPKPEASHPESEVKHEAAPASHPAPAAKPAAKSDDKGNGQNPNGH